MYAFLQDVPIGEDVYDKIRAALGPTPPEGLVMHLVLRRENGLLRYVDVWRDKAAFEAAMRDRIHPAVAGVFREIGFRPDGEPKREEMPVVDVWRGGA